MRNQPDITNEERLRLALDAGRMGWWEWDFGSGKVYWSEHLERLCGLPRGGGGGGGGRSNDYVARAHPADRALVERAVEACLAEGRSEFVHRVVLADGQVRWHEGEALLLVGEDGRARGMNGVASDVTERKQAELLAAGQNRALEQIAAGAPTGSVLELLMLLVEEQSPGALASVVVLDEDGRRLRDGAGPSLSDAYRRAVDGVEVGPSVGSCGTAIYRREQVIVSDIASDPLWVDHRELALAHGLRACWSTPIVASSGEPLGAFAIYRREPGSPSAREFELIESVTHLAGIAIERGRSDRRLAEAEAKYRTLVEQLPLVTYVAALDDPEAPAVYISPQATKMLGYAPEEWTSDASFWSARLLHPDDREHVLAEHEATRMSGKPFAAEYRLLARDGRTVWVLDRATVIRDAEGRPAFFQGYLLDISAEKEVAEALRQSEELYRLVVENASEMICFFAPEGGLGFASPSITDVLGYRPEEAVGWPFASFIHPDDLVEVGLHITAALRGERPAATPARVRHKDGHWVTLEGVASPVLDASGRLEGVVATARDASELRRLEQMLERSQRLEAVGRLAGGIAHDFNNLLTVILGYSDLLRNQLGDGAALGEKVAEIQAALARAQRRLNDSQPRSLVQTDAESEELSHELNNLLVGILGHSELFLDRVREQAELGDKVEQIFRAGESASRLTRQLLAFSRRQVLEPEVIDLNAEVAETVTMLRRTLEASIELRVLPGEGLGRVEADRGQLEQVLVNLAVNARDAMPDGGTLTIETANVELDEGYAPQHPGDAGSGDYVQLTRERHRHRHGRRDARAPVRAVLHDQGARQGHRARARQRLRDRQAKRRHDLGQLHTGGRLALHHLPATGRKAPRAPTDERPEREPPPREAARRSCSSRTKRSSARSSAGCSPNWATG